MKRINCFVVSIIMVVCGCIFASCTADESYEAGQAASDAKAKELEMKIMSLAEEYGLDVQVGNLVSSGLIDDADALEKIDSIFQSACKMKGHYRLTGKRSGERMIISQQSKMGSRKRMLRPAYETYTYDFADSECKGLRCYCSITYDENLNTGELSSVSVDAGAEDPDELGYDVVDEVSGFVDIFNKIRISGSVRVLYYAYYDFEPYLTIICHASGYYDGSDGEISWS